MWFGGLKVKVQAHRVNKTLFHTNDYYAYINAHLTDNIHTTWVGSNSMSAFWLDFSFRVKWANQHQQYSVEDSQLLIRSPTTKYVYNADFSFDECLD